MVRKVGQGKYVVVSEKTGKRLSKPASREATVHRLREIEYFKAHDHRSMGSRNSEIDA